MTDKKSEAMKKAGATREAAYRAYVEGLSANIIVVDKCGEEHEYPDTSNRLKAADSISRLNGDMKEGVVIDNRITNISIGKEEFKVLVDMVGDVRGQMMKLKEEGHQTGEIIDVTVG